ncbi:hypothetical protein H5410_045670, partial [Solanum commersonii]
MSLICGLINTPNLNVCLSSSKTQVQQFKLNVSNSATQDSIMNAHNKTQFTYVGINCVLKDSSCDTPLPKISHAHNTCYLCKFQLNKKIHMQRSHSQRGTQCLFSPIDLPLFSNQSSVRLAQDQKGLSKACNGAECK